MNAGRSAIRRRTKATHDTDLIAAAGIILGQFEINQH